MANETLLLPGPQSLVAGDSTLGYFGLAPAADLIDGDTLARLVGLGAGTAHHPDAGWFKYIRNGRVCFGAKRTLRYGLSYDALAALGLVDGTATITLGGVEYYVRLFEGGNADPTHDSIGYDAQAGVGSEWNQVFYRLTDDANPINVLDSERPFTQWGSYSDAELGVASGYGHRSWTQEVHGYGSSGDRVHRGRNGVSYLNRNTSSNTYSNYGWRPVLEPVHQGTAPKGESVSQPAMISRSEFDGVEGDSKATDVHWANYGRQVDEARAIVQEYIDERGLGDVVVKVSREDIMAIKMKLDI